jgi:hypothetical protein
LEFFEVPHSEIAETHSVSACRPYTLSVATMIARKDHSLASDQSDTWLADGLGLAAGARIGGDKPDSAGAVLGLEQFTHSQA